jgi:hydrogenase small subunit
MKERGGVFLDRPLPEWMEGRGVTRRSFLSFCSVMAATLALPSGYRNAIAEALATARRPVLIWRQFQDCAGNSESMLRSPHPDVAQLVLESFSWNYHELLMAASGQEAEALSSQAAQELKGQYIAVIEGAIPTGDGYCTIGGRSALDLAREVASNAKFTIAVGACAWDGGLVQHGPTGGQGVQDVVPDANVVNLAGCPHNPANTVAVLVYYLTFGEMPALDQYNRPLFAYGDLIHDQCERRAYFDAGLFVEQWGDEGHRKGYCLYKMGCKGPSATFNCPNVRWNDGTSWPVEAGHNCIACASHEFWANASPFYATLPNVPGFGADTTAETVGLGVMGGVLAITAMHAAGKGVQGARARRALRKQNLAVAAEQSAATGAEPPPPPAAEQPHATAVEQSPRTAAEQPPASRSGGPDVHAEPDAPGEGSHEDQD